jgi:hypothetical protein
MATRYKDRITILEDAERDATDGKPLRRFGPNGREAWRGWVIIAKRLRQPEFSANFGRVFERPKFRPRFHA